MFLEQDGLSRRKHADVLRILSDASFSRVGLSAWLQVRNYMMFKLG
jgi:hypothetical protein